MTAFTTLQATLDSFEFLMQNDTERHRIRDKKSETMR